MKHPIFCYSLRTFFASVRVRLTMWYLAIMLFLMVLFGGSLYATQTFLSDSTANSKLETQLYQNAQQFGPIYTQALLQKQSVSTQPIPLLTDGFILLLGADKTVLDMRGEVLPPTAIQQLQNRIDNSLPTIDLPIPPKQPRNWHVIDQAYRVLITPLFEHNARIATLIIGMKKDFLVSILQIWLFHGFIGLLVAAIGGYWIAGKALRPVRMITRMANEINATDLRRRLHFTRRDEFGELAATFDQMLARLEAAFKRQTQFTADASHELRTPLTIINLEINRALTQFHTTNEYQQVLEQIQIENEHMAAIVNKLLLLARADTGQIILHQEELDLSDIALSSVERLLPLAQQSQISIATGAFPEILICGDAHYLNQMMINLVENAIKYTSGIGTRVSVALHCEDEQWGVIQVQDDGPGIAEEHLPYLFDRFYRIDKARSRTARNKTGPMPEARKPDGTGLGLAIVQWIVQAHSGEIHVESTIGKGSLFAVRFPLRKSAKKE